MYGGCRRSCCLCGTPKTVVRLELPPRAIQLCRNDDVAPWDDVVGSASAFLCRSDWQIVSALVLEIGMSPLPRFDASRFAFDRRTDPGARPRNGINDDPERVERRLRERADAVLSGAVEEPSPAALVEARLVDWALEDLDVAE